MTRHHPHDWQYRVGSSVLRCNRCHLTPEEANRCGMELDCLPITVAREPKPARSRDTTGQHERISGSRLTATPNQSQKPLAVPSNNASGTLERIVRWSNSDAAIAAELFILFFATFLFWGLAI